MKIQPEQQIVILGLGLTGLSCYRFCRQYTNHITVLDTRATPPKLTEALDNFPDLNYQLGDFSAETLDAADLILASPGIDLHPLGLDNDKRVIGDIELFAYYAQKPIIAITGTNGKSTVTDMIGAMINGCHLRAGVGGNIGQPALDLLADDATDYYVLELSSFQLETTKNLPLLAAVYLNLTPDHLDRYPNMQAYADAKQRIYQAAQHAIFNADDAYTTPPTGLIEHSFGLHSNADYHVANKFLIGQGRELCAGDSLYLKGIQNWLNALAAFAVGDILQLPRDAMIAAIQDYQGLAHRCEWVAEIDGVQWYNDSKATNVGATVAALQGLGDSKRKNIILLAGGLAKDDDFSDLSDPIDACVEQVVLFGKDAHLLAAAVRDSKRLHQAQSLQEAIEKAKQMAKPGDIVLLSPACASFDMFNNFNERGDLFKQWVRELAQ